MTTDERRIFDELPPDVKRWVLWWIRYCREFEARRKSKGKGTS